MTIQCGFFDSVDGDRRYRAEDMTKPYENLISNGVFATPQGTPSNYLQVIAVGNTMGVTVQAGRGIFKDKWFINDSAYPLTIDTADVTRARIDSIIVKIDANENARTGTIEVKKGNPATNPTPPVMTRSNTVHEYRLANILVGANVIRITQSVITDTRGSNDCPWVTSLIQQVDTSTLMAQWQGAYNDYFASSTREFDQWFNEIKETVATQTLIRTFTSSYVTQVQDETVIPINITQFNSELDILQVHINGLMMVEGVDYTIASVPTSTVTLERPLDVGQQVTFTVYKSVDGSEAESIVESVFALQDVVNRSKLTNDTGGVKMSLTSGDLLAQFKTLGKGFHTVLAGDTVTNTPITGQYWRCFGHITDVPYGWIIAINGLGRAWLNFSTGASSWVGWKEITNEGVITPSPLYKSDSGAFPNNDVVITPSKPLNQCAHGWELMFSGYDDTANVPNDYYVQTVTIPKMSYKGAQWNGERIAFTLLTQFTQESETITQTIKSFEVFNNRIISTSFNSVGRSRKIVLRAIYEY